MKYKDLSTKETRRAFKMFALSNTIQCLGSGFEDVEFAEKFSEYAIEELEKMGADSIYVTTVDSMVKSIKNERRRKK